MVSKHRVHATLEGRPVDRFPVTSLYHHLYHQDHFAELTGRARWELWRWLYADPDEHLATYKALVELTPFELLQPQPAPSRQQREHCEVIEKDGRAFLRHRRTGELTPLGTASGGHAVAYTANETRHIRDRADAEQQLRIQRAEDLIATGWTDYVQAAVGALGADHFILSGGVTGTLWACHASVGLTNLLAMMVEDPDFVEYLSAKHLEQHIEQIRALAAAGGDAIFIDDAIATSDMISVAHYERFCVPHMLEMVREVQRLGHKAIVIYYGGIADRLDQIASLGADGLSMETSMKGYVNDIAHIAAAIGNRVTLFGNLDPIGVLQNGSDALLEREVRRQLAAGRQARGFILCTGSPITPGTPLARVRRFLELGRSAQITAP